MTETRNRILGYDLARALAILGMFIINYEVVLDAGTTGPPWLVSLVHLLEGRAAATFVILAGVGLSLFSKSAQMSNNPGDIARCRRIMLKRAAFLFVFGLLYSPLWPADILHFYGLYMVVGSLVFTRPPKYLWCSAGFFSVGFVILLLTFDYEAGWNWKTLDYSGFWTPTGMTRHIFFNGFHPVFPWTAFLIAGLWLGRQDMRNVGVRRRILSAGAGAVALAELLSFVLLQWAGDPPVALDTETAAALFGTRPMPPMPLYLLSAGGVAFVTITLCIELTLRFDNAMWIRPFSATGQLALTLYVAHVVIGMGLLDALDMLRPQSLSFALGWAILFYAACVLFAVLWTTRFRRGPIESIMRRLTS